MCLFSIFFISLYMCFVSFLEFYEINIKTVKKQTLLIKTYIGINAR